MALSIAGTWLASRGDLSGPRPIERGPLPELQGQALIDWRQRALNALLAPLLDAERPNRWADRTLIDPCLDTAQASVDGEALPYGSDLPSGAFSLRWTMNDCWPLGAAGIGFDGAIEMTIARQDERLDAQVQPRALVAKVDGRRYAVTEPFEARLSIASASYPH
ncbi:hypothetical protein BH09PSE6_BH09PSE6_22700 [soil metagenome]